MRALARFCLLCLVPLLLAGCGVRFAYTQLDWLVPWYLRDYVTLAPAQRTELDRRLGALLDWHCRAQLPDYAALLRDTEAALRAGPLTATQLDALLGRGEDLWAALMAAVAPEAAALLAGLDDAQVDELAAAFEKRNADTRKDFLEGTPDALRERRIARMEKRLRSWFGRLDAAQRNRIAAWSDALEPNTEDWLAHRIAWQQALLAALAQRSARATFDAELSALLRTPEARWAPDYRERVARNRARTLDLLAELGNGASARQRERLLTELDRLASQFERLACTAPATAPV